MKRINLFFLSLLATLLVTTNAWGGADDTNLGFFNFTDASSATQTSTANVTVTVAPVSGDLQTGSTTYSLSEAQISNLNTNVGLTTGGFTNTAAQTWIGAQKGGGKHLTITISGLTAGNSYQISLVTGCTFEGAGSWNSITSANTVTTSTPSLGAASIQVRALTSYIMTGVVANSEGKIVLTINSANGSHSCVINCLSIAQVSQKEYTVHVVGCASGSVKWNNTDYSDGETFSTTDIPSRTNVTINSVTGYNTVLQVVETDIYAIYHVQTPVDGKAYMLYHQKRASDGSLGDIYYYKYTNGANTSISTLRSDVSTFVVKATGRTEVSVNRNGAEAKLPSYYFKTQDGNYLTWKGKDNETKGFLTDGTHAYGYSTTLNPTQGGFSDWTDIVIAQNYKKTEGISWGGRREASSTNNSRFSSVIVATGGEFNYADFSDFWDGNNSNVFYLVEDESANIVKVQFKAYKQDGTELAELPAGVGATYDNVAVNAEMPYWLLASDHEFNKENVSPSSLEDYIITVGDYDSETKTLTISYKQNIPSYNITYNYTFNDIVVYSHTYHDVLKGSTYPTVEIADYYTCTPPTDIYEDGQYKTVTTGGNFTITMALDGVDAYPFAYSANVENATWYYMTQRLSGNKGYVFYDSGRASNGQPKTSSRKIQDNYRWAYIGDPFNGYKIINKEDNTKALSDDVKMVNFANAKPYMLKKMQEVKASTDIPAKISTNYQCYFRISGSADGKGYIHDLNSVFNIWNDTQAATDGGSCVGFEIYNPLSDLTTLYNEVNGYVFGVNPGQYVYSGSADWNETLAAAKNVIDDENRTTEQVENAIISLNNLKSNVTRNEMTAGYYRLLGKGAGRYAYRKGAEDKLGATNELRDASGNYKMANKAIFHFEATTGGYLIKTFDNKKLKQPTGDKSDGKQVELGDDDIVFTVDGRADNGNFKNTYFVHSGTGYNNYLHIGSSSSTTVVGWTTSDNSRWVLEKVTDFTPYTLVYSGLPDGVTATVTYTEPVTDEQITVNTSGFIALQNGKNQPTKDNFTVTLSGDNAAQYRYKDITISDNNQTITLNFETKVTITYKYNMTIGEEAVSATETNKAFPGDAYPARTEPYGVSFDKGVPSGTVTGAETVEFDCTIANDYPVEFGKYYYMTSTYNDVTYYSNVSSENNTCALATAIDLAQSYVYKFEGNPFAIKILSYYLHINENSNKYLYASTDNSGMASAPGGSVFRLEQNGNGYKLLADKTYVLTNKLTSEVPTKLWNDPINGESVTPAVLNFVEASTDISMNVSGSHTYATAYYNVPVKITGVEVFYLDLTQAKNCVSVEDGIVPAETAVILRGETAEATTAHLEFCDDEAETDFTANKLRGVLTEVSIGSGVLTFGRKYVDEKAQEATIGFFTTTATKLPAHRAYLLAQDIPTQQEVKGISLNFDDDPTSISDVDANIDATEIYNLAGQRVNKLQKGINIVNGRKVYVK